MSEAMDLQESVFSIIAASSAVAHGPLTPQMRLQEMDLDSLTFVSVLAQVEAIHGMSIGPDEMFMLMGKNTLGELVEALSELVPGGAA